MDKKFLHKVLDQIVRETMIGNDQNEGSIDKGYGDVMNTPFYTSFPTHLFFIHSTTFRPTTFSDHCEDVYGLKEQEIEYVWNEYRDIIKDKVNNGL